MNKRALFFIFLCLLAALNVASIRKAEDPIRDTQTNPILYEQKKEEDKDGKKGALLYHVKNNPRESFFIDPPFEAESRKSGKEAVTEKALPVSADTAGWWEEQPTDPETTSPAEETAPVTAGEPLPMEEQSYELKDEAKDFEEPTAAADAADSESKGEDYWW